MKRGLVFAVCFLLVVALMAKKPEKTVKVKIFTTMGDMKIELYNETPQHRDNFVKLVNDKFYDGILFHRVIEDFMIQAGDPYSKLNDPELHLGAGDIGYLLDAEIVYPQYYHKKGALVSARTGDSVNPEKKSSGCQFYIVDGKQFTDDELDVLEQKVQSRLKMQYPFKFTEKQRRTYKLVGGTPQLDAQYTIFGGLIEGFDVLQKISAIETAESDRPKVDVKIIKMKIVRR